MRDTDMSSRFAGAPLALLEAERLLLIRALTRTIEAGDQHAEAAARRCIEAVEAEILTREDC